MKLEITGFSAGYNKKPIVTDISFTLQPKTLTALLGPNGCGKTTLFKGLCHLIPSSGSCMLTSDDGGAPYNLMQLNNRKLAQHISYIPQKSSISASMPVLEAVLMGFQPFLPLLSRTGKSHRAAAFSALETVGMQDFAAHDFCTLSEGQKQLCILARTLVQNTDILLLDEPDSALDYPNRNKILNILRKIVYDNNKAGLLILHDPCTALNHCAQLLLMKEGRLIGSVHPDQDSETVLSEALSQLYGPVQVFRQHNRFFLYPL